jgi:hypothetical protein
MKMDQEPKKVEELNAAEEAKQPSELKAEEKPKTNEDLRSSPRLQCSGLAGIQTLPVSEKPFPAKIMNLSVGGCLMKLEMPLILAMDEIVELLFCVNQMPFRVRGKVRAIRSDTLIGFQFPHLSTRSRRQLEDLIGELIEHIVKLHRESIANRPVPDNESDHSVPSVRKAHAIGMLYPIRPDEGQSGNTSHRA